MSSIPEPLPLAAKLAPAATALLVVDVQNDYASPEGWLGRRGADLESAVAVLPRIRQLVVAAREIGVLVVFTRNWHRPATDTEAWLDKLHRSGQSAQDRPGMAGTWGAELAGLVPEAGEEVVSKSRYDAFLGTNLEGLLRARGIRTVVFAGTTTNVCVESTARAAHMRDFHVVVVADCCAAPDPGEHAAALVNIRRYFGEVTTAGAVMSAWRAWLEGPARSGGDARMGAGDHPDSVVRRVS